MQKRVSIVVLGCPKNEVDAEVFAGELVKSGFEVIADYESSDSVIIFTCGFLKKAVEESIETILEISFLKKRIIVTGCLVSRYGIKKLEELLPEVEKFFGTYNYLDIVTYLEKGSVPSVSMPKFIYSHKNERITNSQFAYVKISEGCSNNCAFCVIPAIKGRLISREKDDIVQEVKILTEEKGIKEIILISQNSGDYGKDLEESTNLHELMKAILNIDALEWLRVLYVYPDYINDEFLELFSHEKLCNYMEMPLQHIDNEILRLMRRKSNEKKIRMLLDKIKSDYPQIFLRTSLIVGFPGETEKKFKKLVDFIKEYEFYNLGTFIYSKEEGTKAEKMPFHVDNETKRKRYDIIMKEQSKIMTKINSSLTGKIYRTFISGFSEETELLLNGRTEFQSPEIDGTTYITEGFIDAPGFYNVEITDFKDYDLIGKIV